MKVRKCSEGAFQPTNFQIELDVPLLRSSTSKIIQSYQELVKSLQEKVGQLTTDLELTQNKLSLTETRYSTLAGFLDSCDKVQVQKLADRVDELEKKIIHQNAEILRLKAKLVRVEAGDFSLGDDNGVNRNEIGLFFNFERIRENEQIMKRQRRNSVQENENSIPWERALEQYSDNVSSPTKFKQKTLPILKKFIPHEQRHRIWPYVFQNQLGITDSLYIELTERRACNTVPPCVHSQIYRDIMRSFSCKMNLFGEQTCTTRTNNKEILSADVQEVLQIFHLFRPDVSYVQGMTYPVIVLTIIVGKIEAFKIFSNLVLCNKFFRNMYCFEGKSIQAYCQVFDWLLREFQPETSKHLEMLRVKSEIYLIEWFFTMFSRGLSLETTLKIWDLIAYQRELVLFRLCLAIFEQIGKRLLVQRYEETVGLIQSYWACIDEPRLLDQVVNSKLTNEKLAKTFSRAARQFQGPRYHD